MAVTKSDEASVCSVVHRSNLAQGSLHSVRVDGRRKRPWLFHESSFVVATFRTDEIGEDRHGGTSLSISKLATLDASLEASSEALRLACSFAATYEDFVEPGPNRGRPARG